MQIEILFFKFRGVVFAKVVFSVKNITATHPFADVTIQSTLSFSYKHIFTSAPFSGGSFWVPCFLK